GSAAAMKAGTPRRTGQRKGADLSGQQQVDSPGVQQESLSSASPSIVTPDGGAGTSRPAQVASSVRVGDRPVATVTASASTSGSPSDPARARKFLTVPLWANASRSVARLGRVGGAPAPGAPA